MRNDIATDLSHERYVVEVRWNSEGGIPGFRESAEGELTA
jgi:hypothetical protein